MQLPQTVYISGPMSGLPENNFPAFHRAATALRERGYTVVNPAEIAIENPSSWTACMRADIKALCDCEGLALLPGWQNSKGAHVELNLAHRLEMRINTVQELLDARPAIASMSGPQRPAQEQR